jgi:lipopolysaccharide biosynthesis protein
VTAGAHPPQDGSLDRPSVAPQARAIAFYLPQFHPIPENDEWWGPGFSEWTSAARARRLFPGHAQPHLPADLGFYDLRLPEARESQAELAQLYGIEAFCYWHYWFAGRRILERPYDEMLESGRPNFSFCLGWANQTWSGTWHGAPDRILIEQTYPGLEDDRRHFEHVLPAFRDPRYFRVDGRPLFYVFRPELLPEPAAFVERWQESAARAGLGPLYLVAENSDLLGRGPKYATARQDGFDATVYIRLPAAVGAWETFKMRVARKLLRWPERYHYARAFPEAPPSLRGETTHPCIYPNWDNTPRSGRHGLVITHSSPDAFKAHAHAAVRSLLDRPFEQRLLFVKSWNEWAEGNYLEPDLEYGHGFLQALADTVFAK